jgi:hypothetical protein
VLLENPGAVTAAGVRIYLCAYRLHTEEEVRGNRGFDGQFILRFGAEGYGLGMKHQAWITALRVRVTVPEISEDRMAESVQVNADLVTPAGRGAGVDECCPRKTFENTK